MLLLSTDANDVVIDPFAGSGVVVAEARRLERRGIGLELVEAHRSLHTLVLPEITDRRGVDILQVRLDRSVSLRRTILDLRAVKYPKVLMKIVRERDSYLPRPRAAYVLQRQTRAGQPHIEIVIVLRDDDMAHADAYLDEAQRSAHRAPASKFGITPQLRVLSESEISALHRGRRLHAYIGGQTHRAAGLSARSMAKWADTPTRHDTPLVVSNVFVDESPRRLKLAETGTEPALT